MTAPDALTAAPLLEVRAVKKHYQTGAGPLEVLSGLSFTVARGEVVAVTGESGSGKSTLLHLLGTLDRPSSGSVRFQGQDVFRLDDEALATFRNRSLGFVFQHHHLLPEFTAAENVAMPALIAGQRLGQARVRAEELLRRLGLGARLEHRPAALSGGEQQRVAIARALMNAPALVLADEPTGNLDAATAETLHAEIVRLSRDLGQTFIIVTHNPSLAALADRVLRLAGGFLQEEAAGIHEDLARDAEA